MIIISLTYDPLSFPTGLSKHICPPPKVNTQICIHRVFEKNMNNYTIRDNNTHSCIIIKKIKKTKLNPQNQCMLV